MLGSSGAAAVLAANNNSGGSALGFLFPVVLIAGFYLLFMRPARARQRRAVETRSNVTPGVEVVTTGGLIGHVVEVDDETLTVEIAPGVHAKFLKQAIARVVVPPEPPLDADLPDDAAPDTPSTPQA